MASNIKLTNIIGAPFSDHVLRQLYIRAARNSTTTRTNEEVLFLANKTGWARLISSVDIELPYSELKSYYEILGINLTNYTPKSLARDWILEAGTSKQAGNGVLLRSGLGPDGAYGLGGTQELGYRPIPGLTSVVVETVGRLGSLRQATITFQVWNMNQLNVIEALYFRLGYSMLLEWGHTQYFDNNNTFVTSEIYGINDPFEQELRKEGVQQRIAQKVRQSSGNYDGMLGIVSNFTWSLNDAGGYDCVVRLIGQGAVMDSLKIDQAYTLPNGLLKEYKKNQSAIEEAIQKAAEKLAKQELDRQARIDALNKPALKPLPKSKSFLLERLQQYDSYTGTGLVDLEKDYGVDVYTTAESLTQGVPTTVLGYYTLFNSSTSTNLRLAAEEAYGGLWIDRPGLGFVRLPYLTESNIVFDTNLFNYVTNLDLVSIQTTAVTPTTGTPVTQYFDSRIASITTTTAVGVGGVSQDTVNTPLDKPLRDSRVTVTYRFLNVTPYRGSNKEVYVAITANINLDQTGNFKPTRKQLGEILENWQKSGGNLSNVKISSKKKNEVIITGNFTQTVTAKYSGPVSERAAAIQLNNGSEEKGVEVLWTVETNNPGFIAKVLPVTPISTVSRQATGTVNQGSTDATVNQANSSQVESTTGFTSALHAMLVIVQTAAQRQALNITTAGKISILDYTKKFFEEGSLKGVLNLPASTPVGPDGLPFDLLRYGKKGYNSSLMYDKTYYDLVPDVNFEKLCQAYVVKYRQGGEEGTSQAVHCPVYIPFGYLLAFLNNMCLIYDTVDRNKTQTGEKRPFIYIDFNPETNYCLTTPQQMSVDPFTCLIPFNATLDDYKALFPTKQIANNLSPAAFDPQTNNVVTEALNLDFKTNNPYQGKIMNILLNVDYLLGLVKDFANSDAENAVNLQPFLERILRDVNKCTGNINSFRVGYRDESNTIQILDDQWVPAYKGTAGSDTSIMDANSYNQKLGDRTQKELSGILPLFNSSMPAQLPVAGTFSLAREFRFQTVMSTKLASMIAISAQASTGSVNAKDHSSLSWLNQNYKDRYSPAKENGTAAGRSTNNNSLNKVNEQTNDQRAAELFNVHVSSVYSNLEISPDKIGLAKNYYIERMSNTKAEDTITSAAPFIPANLEITIDGVSGIIMGNAFTIPEDRLPLSLRGINGRTKIGFIVTGLIHTVEQNEWLTRIKGQMIKLRSDVTIPTATAIVSGLQKAIAPPLSKYAGLTGDSIEDAINFIKSQEKLYSALPNKYREVLNPTPDTIVYAYQVETDKPTIGYGTTVYAQGTRIGTAVKLGDSMKVSEAEAEIRIRVSANYSNIVASLGPTIKLTPGQMAALLSIAYSTGLGALKGSQVWAEIKQGADKETIAQTIRNFALTRASDGVRLPGLITRRQKESQIFLS